MTVVKQALVLVIVSAVIGGALNLIRHDRVPWIPKSSTRRIQVVNPTDEEAIGQPLDSTPYLPKAILTDAVEKLLEKGAVIIDCRLPEFYAEGHIPGAINIPFESGNLLMLALSAIPKDAQVIIYCDGVGCDLSTDLATYMIMEGYREVYDYQGGWEEWSASRGIRHTADEELP
jgi:rhodanese-related sulfurtransferase